MSLPSFPHAQQAQIIRANQRDLYHVSSLRDQSENVLRSWFGTRWLARWDKEVDLLVKLVYYGFTTGRATQTLGEEYTDIWQYSSNYVTPPSSRARVGVILLPTLLAYFLGRWGSTSFGERYPFVRMLLKTLPVGLETLAEINLAIFYLRGTYYSIVKRLFGIRHLSTIPENPHTRPPSYALLGILLIARLVHRLITTIRSYRSDLQLAAWTKGKEKAAVAENLHETFLDDRPLSSFLGPENPEGLPAKPAEEDERTVLDVASIPDAFRVARNCTLCLEERTDSCSTECGHLFCWSCIVGWGREKAECPLCRQSLNLGRLLPIYNL